MNPEIIGIGDEHVTQVAYDKKCCYAKRWSCRDKKIVSGRPDRITGSTLTMTKEKAMLTVSDDLKCCSIALTFDDARAITEVLCTWLDWNDLSFRYDGIEEVDE